MSEPHVIAALRRKRSELGGVLSQPEQRLVKHRAFWRISMRRCGCSIQISGRRRSVPGSSEHAVSGSVPVNACGRSMTSCATRRSQ